MNLNKYSIFIILFIIIFIEASVLLFFTQNMDVLGGDGPEYNSLAVNLIDKGVFSSQTTEPYEPTLYRAVGYPLFLDSIYAVVSRSVVGVRIVQFIILFLTCCFIYLLAKRFCDETSAAWAAMFCSIYLPMVFFPLYHLTETVSTFLTVFSIFLVSLIQNKKSYLLACLLGLTLGALSQIRPSFFLFTGLILICILIANKVSFKTRITHMGLLLIFAAMCILPWTIRNKQVSNEFIPLAVGKGISLYASAQQYAGEISHGIPTGDWEKIISEDKRRSVEYANQIKSEDLLQTNTSPRQYPINTRVEILKDKIYTTDAINKFASIPLKTYLIKYPERLLYLFSTGDIAPVEIYTISHRLAQFQFAIFALLTAVGLFLQRKRLFEQYLLWVTAFYIIVIHSIFHIEPRYSLQARPFLLIYAGIGIIALHKYLKNFVTQRT